MFKLPTVRLSALERKMQETEWKLGVTKCTWKEFCFHTCIMENTFARADKIMCGS